MCDKYMISIFLSYIQQQKQKSLNETINCSNEETEQLIAINLESNKAETKEIQYHVVVNENHVCC